MRNITACLYVSPDDRATLERIVADGKTPQKIAARARVVLASGRGLGTNAIMREARVSKPAVWLWQGAFMECGVARLQKDKGKGPKAGKRPLSDEIRLAIVTKTAKEKPANATHWSARTMAKDMGVRRGWCRHVRHSRGRPLRCNAKRRLGFQPKSARRE